MKLVQCLLQTVESKKRMEKKNTRIDQHRVNRLDVVLLGFCKISPLNILRLLHKRLSTKEGLQQRHRGQRSNGQSRNIAPNLPTEIALHSSPHIALCSCLKLMKLKTLIKSATYKFSTMKSLALQVVSLYSCCFNIHFFFKL